MPMPSLHEPRKHDMRFKQGQETTMKLCQRGSAVVLAAAFIALLTACGEPKSQAKVDREVAEQKSEAASDMADARKDASKEMMSARKDAQQTMQNADRKEVQAKADLMTADADANYKLAMEQATGDHDVAMKRCEALVGEPKQSCKDRANAEFAEAQARAHEERAQHTPAQS
jgi:hypothetical protein